MKITSDSFTLDRIVVCAEIFLMSIIPLNLLRVQPLVEHRSEKLKKLFQPKVPSLCLTLIWFSLGQCDLSITVSRMFTSSQLEKGISGVGINRGWIDKCGRGSVAALEINKFK